MTTLNDASLIEIYALACDCKSLQRPGSNDNRILQRLAANLPGEIADCQLTLNYGEDGNQVVNDTVPNWRNVDPCGN